MISTKHVVVALRRIFVILVAAVSLNSTSSAAERGTVSGLTNTETPDWFKDSFLEIAEDAIEADEAQKHVMLFFHLNDCPYCRRLLEENFFAGKNKAFIQENFDAIEINMRGDREVVFDETTTLIEKDLAAAVGVKFTPSIIFIDSKNKQVARVDGYRDTDRFRTVLEYVQSKAYENTTLAKFSQDARSKDPSSWTFDAHPAFMKSNDLNALADEPLAIVFEDAHCAPSCSDVHATLFSRNDVRAELKKLKVVRLDAQSEDAIVGPDGSATTPKALAESLNLTYRPAIVLYDQGEVRSRINNRLYSWHFTNFLSWVSGRHYDDFPNVYDYMGQQLEKKVAAGEDVNFVDN